MCEHIDFDEYFERCNDCDTALADMSEEVQLQYLAQFNEDTE